MLSHRTGLLLAVLAVAAHAPLQAQQQAPAVDSAAARAAPPRRPMQARKDPAAVPTPPASASPSTPAPPASAAAAPAAPAPGQAAPGVTAVAPAALASLSPEEWRRRLGLCPLNDRVIAVPGASVASPTAFALDGGEAFAGAAYQARTRYTDLQDAALVVGVGLGDRERAVGVELAATSYATVRDGGPFADGSLSAKVHRSLGRDMAVAVGVENGVRWGQTDAGTSVYGAATRAVRLRRASQPFSSAAVTLGVGNGRFRREEDIVAGRERVNVFGAVGVRVIEPLSLTADWTGQDLYAAVSLRPTRRVPLVVTVGAADITGSAGDGARLIVSAGYGFRIPRIP